MRAFLGLTFLLLLASPEPAEACACCSAVTTMKPLGWTEAGGAILLEQTSNVACERLHQLVVWHVGKAAPAGCYDLLGNPDTRVACASPGSPADGPRAAKPRRSQAEQTFVRAAAPLDASKVRLKSRPAPAAPPDSSAARFRLAVEVEAGGTWRQVWSGALDGVRAGSFGATLWPSPRGDRALLLLTYANSGTANRAVLAHWVQLTAP